MKRKQYMEEVKKIPAEPSKFSQLGCKEVEVAKIESQVNNIIKGLEDAVALDPKPAWQIKARGSKLPQLYSLTNIHKLKLDCQNHNHVPMQPILSTIHSPYDSLAKWLCELLQPLRDDLFKHRVHDSFEFAKLIRTVDLPNQNWLHLMHRQYLRMHR